MQWEINNLIISRSCNLHMQDLQDFVCEEISHIFSEIDQLRTDRNLKGSKLVEHLYDLVSQANNESRNALIRIKRNIFNDKKPNKEDTELVKSYDNKLKLLYEEWEDKFLHEKSLHMKLKEVYDSYVDKVRNKMVYLCSNSDFQKGIQLSGQRFLKKLHQYADAVAKNVSINKPLRQTEDGLISFLYRMALKPSPFGAFTDINLHLANEPDHNLKHSFCSPSRLLVQWLAYQCHKLPLLKEALPIRMNQTLSREDGCILFFSRPDDGTSDMFGKEKFVKIKDTPMIQKIESLLTNKAMNKTNLIHELSTKDLLANQIAEYIENLIRIGLLQRHYNIPDQTKRYCQAVAKQLGQFEDPTIQSIAYCFEQMHEIELELQHSTVQQREKLINDFRNHFLKVVELTNSENPGLNDARSFFYEDVGRIYSNQSEVKERFMNCKSDLAVLSKLLPLLDDSAIERFSLYKLFKKIYPQSESIDLLKFYKDFTHFDVKTLTEIMSGKHDDEAKTIRQKRAEWYQALHEMLQKHPESDVLEIDKNWLNDFISTIPSYVGEWQSTCFYLQPCESHTDQNVVLNGASMGYGAMMSRFAMIYEDNEDGVTQIFSDELYGAAQAPQMVDLTSVLGINTNLHPAILKSAIEYPGCMADRSDLTKIYTLKDLRVQADDATHRLKLICKQTNTEIAFRPLNILFPTVGPSLYRFLYLFSPYNNFKGGFWNRYLSYYPVNENIILPRLKMNNVILNRKTWIFDSSSLPQFDLTQTDFITIVSEMEKWRRKVNLPINGFYHQSSYDKQFEDWVSAVKNTIKTANKIKLRKPHFLDFRSPFLIRILMKHLNETKETQFVFQECLPDSEHYLKSTEVPAAREFLIQLDKTVN